MISKETVIKDIKSKGYWEVNIHPIKYASNIIESRQSAKELISKNSTELGGWDYPHINLSENLPYFVKNGVEQVSCWEKHIELWRVTLSGNFFQLLALVEDRTDLNNYKNMWQQEDGLKGEKFMGVLRTLYTFTKIFEFSRRLSNEPAFESGLDINIKLYDMENRQLFVDSYDRLPFSFPRVYRDSGDWQWNKKQEAPLSAEKVEDLVLESSKDLFEMFSWENPPFETFKSDIQKFLGSRV